MARHRLTAPPASIDDRVDYAARLALLALIYFPIVTIIDGLTEHGILRAIGITA
jgi:hypothetical protein